MSKCGIWIICYVVGMVLCLSCCSPQAQQYINKIIYQDLPLDTTMLPEKNKALLVCAAYNGPCIAPTYKEAVCTEYLIGVLEGTVKLTTEQKKRIRIITEKDLGELLREGSPVIKGVYYALTSSGQGIAIDKLDEVKAGDLVQFWDYYSGKPRGHCGIVRALDLEKGLISIYSSSISTNGHGKQLYVMPQYAYFVRLK